MEENVNVIDSAEAATDQAVKETIEARAQQPRMYTEAEIRRLAKDEVEKKDNRNQKILQAILLVIIAILLGFVIVFFMLNVEMLATSAIAIPHKIPGSMLGISKFEAIHKIPGIVKF